MPCRFHHDRQRRPCPIRHPVRRVVGRVTGNLRRQIARRVQRNPPVEPDHHERKQRLIQPAARILPRRIPQVQPHRVGDPVAVVVHVVSDLPRRTVGSQVRERRRVVAIRLARPQNPRRRVRPEIRSAGTRLVLSGPVVDRVVIVVPDDPRPVKRRNHHRPVGTLNRQEPVLQVARVIVLIHPDQSRRKPRSPREAQASAGSAPANCTPYWGR